jgi:CheY-like chemotaxis protein
MAGGVNEKEFIDELIFCLEQEDIVKSKALLQFASDANISPVTQIRALHELAKGPEKVVFPLLEYLTRIEISDPEIQDGLYDLILDKAYKNTQLVIDYITENEKKTRVLFLRAAGDLFLAEAADPLISIITRETDTDILFEAITALGALRIKKALPVFSDMMNQPDMKIKRAAVFAIAQIDGKESVDRLLSFISKNEELNKIVVEALTDIQDLYALEKLTSLLKSTETIVRDTAIDGLMKLGNKAVPILTRASRNAGADYLVHLITTLGYIGDPAALPSIIDIINTQPENANIRQAAYEAMERIPSPKSAICLAQGLQDPVESVRMSAARAIDHNLSKALVAGLKNIVRTDSPEAMNAVSALIDSESANIFNFLVQEESFLAKARTNILRKADPVSRENFLKHMNGIGQKDFVNSVKHAVEKHPAKASAAADAPEINIIVVDDSKMMLKLYQNKLSTLGFKPSLFQKPEEAIPEIIKQKPDLVITDLNMPNISGLELTREIRRKFAKSDLPIIMITTQSDFIEEKNGDIQIDDSVLTRSGINTILHKPFTDELFKETILPFIKK